MPRKRKKSAKERFLGVIETEIAGIQYHDGEVAPGEPVHLVREPDKSHEHCRFFCSAWRRTPARTPGATSATT